MPRKAHCRPDEVEGRGTDTPTAAPNDARATAPRSSRLRFTPLEERPMSRLLMALVLVLAGVLSLSVYLRWFHVA
jgi:hypothetical protein